MERKHLKNNEKKKENKTKRTMNDIKKKKKTKNESNKTLKNKIFKEIY